MAEENDSSVAVENLLDLTEQQIKEIKRIATTECDRGIKKIYTGMLGYLPGVKVEFNDQVINTYSISRYLTIGFKRYFRTNTPGKNNYQTVGFKNNGLTINIKRVFKLKRITICLELPNELSYEKAGRLLKSIELGNYTIKAENPPSSSRNLINMSQIIGLSYSKKENAIEIVTEDRRPDFEVISGGLFKFKEDGSSFNLIYAGGWIS